MTLPEAPPRAGALPWLVLDTNVVLDWLVFRDPGCDALADALRGDRVAWIATAAMRDELAHVLARGSLDAWQPDASALWSSWERWARMVGQQPAPVPAAPRCTDPDDQKFIDLALQVGAHALLSRDRAVLRCARPARALGLQIMTPSAWALRGTP